MQLYPTPDNPIPGRPDVAMIDCADRMPLRAAWWAPATRQVRGTVCLLQGRAEFIEKYFEVVRDLRRRGFAVAAFDWRGQGLSGRRVRNGRKGHVGSFAEYAFDIAAIRDRVLIPHMPGPHFALAHSMGGAIALNEAYEGRFPFVRLVTTSPMLGLRMVRRPAAAARVAVALNLVGLGSRFVPGGGETSIAAKPFAGNRLTGDPVRYARNAAAAEAVGEGAIGDPTIAWIDGAFRLMKRLAEPKAPLGIRLPTLILAAGADPLCATPATERFAARLKAGNAIVLPGARHEILMERDVIRELFWTAFDSFIPGAPDRGAPPPLPVELLASEESEGGRMDAAVAGGDDGAALRR